MALLLLLVVGGAARQLVEAFLPGPPQVLHQQGGTSEHGHTAQHRDQDGRQGGGGATRPCRRQRQREREKSERERLMVTRWGHRVTDL